MKNNKEPELIINATFTWLFVLMDQNGYLWVGSLIHNIQGSYWRMERPGENSKISSMGMPWFFHGMAFEILGSLE